MAWMPHKASALHSENIAHGCRTSEELKENWIHRRLGSIWTHWTVLDLLQFMLRLCNRIVSLRQMLTEITWQVRSVSSMVWVVIVWDVIKGIGQQSPQLQWTKMDSIWSTGVYINLIIRSTLKHHANNPFDCITDITVRTPQGII